MKGTKEGQHQIRWWFQSLRRKQREEKPVFCMVYLGYFGQQSLWISIALPSLCFLLVLIFTDLFRKMKVTINHITLDAFLISNFQPFIQQTFFMYLLLQNLIDMGWWRFKSHYSSMNFLCSNSLWTLILCVNLIQYGTQVFDQKLIWAFLWMHF